MTLAMQALLLAAQLVVGAPEVSAAATPLKPVEVVVFSDFQCPFCAQLSRPLRELQATGVDGVTMALTFKNFPLPMHQRAQLAHQAALAAGEQGKFWEMHDLLFANQQHAQRDDLIEYAGRLGLDLDRFRRDMDSDRIKQVIEADKADGRQLHVNGTPTFYVNGREFSGNTPLADLKRILVAEQRRARTLDDVDDTSMSRGPANAPVTLEMFVDLRSPVSRPALDAVNELMLRYPSQVRLQFRHFPLAFHPYAALAHEAAVTAARSGRFWEFAASLLDHQGSLREPELVAMAGRIGLDEAAFARALREHVYAPRVDADLQMGLKKGIRGSPAILLNGRRIDGVPGAQTLTEYVEAALSRRQTAELRKQ